MRESLIVVIGVASEYAPEVVKPKIFGRLTVSRFSVADKTKGPTEIDKPLFLVARPERLIRDMHVPHPAGRFAVQNGYPAVLSNGRREPPSVA